MKIASYKIDEFIASPPANIKAVLLYGPDLGLISLRAKKLEKLVLSNSDESFNKADINFSKLKENQAIFFDEVYSMSLIGGQKLIKLRDVQAKPSSELTALIDFAKDYEGDNFVILTSFDLKPTSPLRKIFEKEKHLASLPCYKDDAQSIKQVIKSTLSIAGYNFNNDVVEYLSSNFSGDRMIIVSELEKLMIYVGSNKQITLDDAINSIGNANELSLSNLCNAVASQNSILIEKNLQIALNESTFAVVIIRACLNYFVKLHKIKAESLATKIPTDKIVESIKPPIFFKQLPVLKSHARKWQISSLNKTISALIDLECDCKSGKLPDELILKRFFAIFSIAVRN